MRLTGIGPRADWGGCAAQAGRPSPPASAVMLACRRWLSSLLSRSPASMIVGRMPAATAARAAIRPAGPVPTMMHGSITMTGAFARRPPPSTAVDRRW